MATLIAIDLKPGSQRLKAIDLQYHDMRVDKCLALRAGLDTIVTAAEARTRHDRASGRDPRLLPWSLS